MGTTFQLHREEADILLPVISTFKLLIPHSLAFYEANEAINFIISAAGLRFSILGLSKSLPPHELLNSFKNLVIIFSPLSSLLWGLLFNANSLSHPFWWSWGQDKCE